jgi:sec-independent protein translocase protein TatA
MRLGPWEIGLIVVVILIVFGVGKLPQVGGAVGKAIREFRKSQRVDYDSEESKPQSSTGATTQATIKEPEKK